MSDYADAVNAVYGRPALATRLFEALERAGVDPDRLTLDALSAIDELHLGGREHTLQLGHLAQVTQGIHVIDVGCGIGGPARALAHCYGCKVTGVDLTSEYCSVGRILTERTGLEHRVKIHHANALDLPFEEGTFDLAWMQHTALNIPDKAQLFSEIARVLRPRGKIALYEILAGPEPAVHLPVPWTHDATLNFLVTEDELRRHLDSAGFVSEMWEDVTEECAVQVSRVLERVTGRGLPPLNPSVLLGPEYPLMVMNLSRNFDEDRLRVLQAILRIATASG
jgi:ubiquinone/menaquinone biosynthesis C-methylase UbiE